MVLVLVVLQVVTLMWSRGRRRERRDLAITTFDMRAQVSRMALASAPSAAQRMAVALTTEHMSTCSTHV